MARDCDLCLLAWAPVYLCVCWVCICRYQTFTSLDKGIIYYSLQSVTVLPAFGIESLMIKAFALIYTASPPNPSSTPFSSCCPSVATALATLLLVTILARYSFHRQQQIVRESAVTWPAKVGWWW